MYSGYIKLWRKFSETSFYRSSTCVHLAVHLLIKCNHEPKKIVFNKEEITIERGQCLTGRKALAQETGISEQSVRTAIYTLKSTSFLTIKVTNKFSIISIGKYSDYQNNVTSKSTNNLTNHQPTTNQQLTTNNNDKNDKNDKNTTIAPDKPDAEAGNKLVNWENCRTDLQRLAAYYLKCYAPAMYASATTAQATEFFKRQSRALTSICRQAGDVEVAKKILDIAADYYFRRPKPLTWNLDTVARNIIEFIDKAKMEVENARCAK